VDPTHCPRHPATPGLTLEILKTELASERGDSPRPVRRRPANHYRGSEIHNEILHDESAAFAIDRKYPESDHAPVVATFDF
jgi:hypothetical protein